jgi:hypothetical protein
MVSRRGHCFFKLLTRSGALLRCAQNQVRVVLQTAALKLPKATTFNVLILPSVVEVTWTGMKDVGVPKRVRCRSNLTLIGECRRSWTDIQVTLSWPDGPLWVPSFMFGWRGRKRAFCPVDGQISNSPIQDLARSWGEETLIRLLHGLQVHNEIEHPSGLLLSHEGGSKPFSMFVRQSPKYQECAMWARCS